MFTFFAGNCPCSQSCEDDRCFLCLTPNNHHPIQQILPHLTISLKRSLKGRKFSNDLEVMIAEQYFHEQTSFFGRLKETWETMYQMCRTKEWIFRMWAIITLHYFLSFLALRFVFSFSPPVPFLPSIYTSLLGKLLDTFLWASCFQYILWVSDSPSSLSWLCVLEISTLSNSMHKHTLVYAFHDFR